MQQFINSLEPRRLMAATLENGVLSVVGTDESDSIVVSTVSPGANSRIVTRTRQVTVTINGGMSTFEASDVKAIKVVGLGGNDRITLPLAIPGSGVTVGQSGTVEFTDYGDFRGSLVTNSPQQLQFGLSNVPAYVEGGSGNDTIIGGDGNDTLRGGRGNDVITDPRGVNRLEGGEGNDIIDAREGKTFNLVPVEVEGQSNAYRVVYGAAPFGTRPDGIIGGEGADILYAEHNDIHSGIESVNIAQTPGLINIGDLEDGVQVINGNLVEVIRNDNGSISVQPYVKPKPTRGS